LSLIAFAGWIVRRHETELLLISASGLAWFARNHHFFVEQQPFNQLWYVHATTLLSYFAPLLSAGFCFYFLDIARRRDILGGMAVIGVIAWLLHVAGFAAAVIVYLPAFLLGVATFFIVLFWSGRPRTVDHWAMATILGLVALTSLHDIVRGALGGQGGIGFWIQPYFGLIFALGFLASFGRRALGAFDTVTALNTTLEQRIEIARQDLLDSEEKRRQLEVDAAVGSERERLMREMHDGIGSNLVMALAVAEKQNQPKSTITTLRRALSDLRITVDSLEQFGGDLVALLGNFRHRLQPELKRAGVTTRWRVEPCPPLLWLDATNALHVMRFFQEALGNALTHADATQIEIGCHPETRDGAAGVSAWLADNGRGFDVTEAREGGKGLANMAARARALHGSMDVASDPATGTRLAIWLPEQQLAYTKGAGAAQPQIVRAD
jgi:signal transduction histidine kinase